MGHQTDGWETLYRRIAETSVMKEYTELELETESMPDPEPSDKFIDFMNELIEDLDQKEKSTLPRKRIRHRLIAIAAVISILTGLALTAGAMGVKFSTLFANSSDTHTDMVFRDNLTLPAGWDAVYYITALPDGYQLTDQSSSNGFLTSVYSNPNESVRKSVILYQYKEAPDILSMDTEGMEQKEMEIQGVTGTCFWNEDRVLLAWQHGEDYLMLGTSLEESIALIAANSVQK